MIMTGDEDLPSCRFPTICDRRHRHDRNEAEAEVEEGGGKGEGEGGGGGEGEARQGGHPRLFSHEWNQQPDAAADLEENPFFKVKVLSPPNLPPHSETIRSSEDEDEEEVSESEVAKAEAEDGEEKGVEKSKQDEEEGGKGENSEPESVFAGLYSDLLIQIMGAFSWPNLWAASRVCRSWKQALEPLRSAMFLVHQGKMLKHGRGGVQRNPEQALDCFLTGAARGCAAAMVDAGLLLWEMGRREDGMKWYRKAAELGDPAGQYNLGLAYLQDPSNPTEAVTWFHQAALAGHLRAQHSYALCLQQGRGVESSVVKAAQWYLRAAEGGSARAMYNVSLCYSKGEGLEKNLREARHWMKNAAFAGHRKAQFQYGLTLFRDGDSGLSLVFFELATRAGEAAAIHPRDLLLHQLSPNTCAHALSCANKWQVKQNS